MCCVKYLRNIFFIVYVKLIVYGIIHTNVYLVIAGRFVWDLITCVEYVIGPNTAMYRYGIIRSLLSGKIARGLDRDIIPAAVNRLRLFL